MGEKDREDYPCGYLHSIVGRFKSILSHDSFLVA